MSEWVGPNLILHFILNFVTFLPAVDITQHKTSKKVKQLYNLSFIDAKTFGYTFVINITLIVDYQTKYYCPDVINKVLFPWCDKPSTTALMCY